MDGLLLERDAGPVPDADRFLSDLRFDEHKPLAIAVSGGGDSVALLDLTRSAITARAPNVQICAITVDHGLRPDSVQEARWVGTLCTRLGIRHRTMTWLEPHGDRHGLIARAREARYDLLARAADEIGAEIILLGHTRDDQAETVAMRSARSLGTERWDRGASGMARATLFEGRTWLARPLLDTSRAALREYLRERKLPWIDDPTNEDLRYERSRVRASLQGDEATSARLAREASQAAQRRTETSRRAGDLLDRFASRPSPGLYRIDAGLLAEGDDDATIYAFRSLLATVGGTAQLPDHARSAGLMERLHRMGLCATLSRTRVEVHPEGIFMCRENRTLPRLPAAPGLLWDRRYLLTGVPEDKGIVVAPMGTTQAREGSEAPSGVPKRLVAAGLCAEPGLWRANEVVLDDIGNDRRRFERVVSPFVRYLGAFDLALAHALARLVGARPPPASPWAQHISG